ncbi:MAG: manganese efflux pump [Ruminococcus sp.]|uniref:manganese efflux pump n=1 Tax=Ruminococcus sp. TaxID=41978 RepID=UPI0025DD8547|nr:manganese efflux pump [Ruminococcus sp.]MCR4794738.1 manganese efflux pump [Ruminococcus sp.]
MLKEIFLAFIVSIDTFLAAAACCNSGIKIPILSAAVIDFICAAVLGISIAFSQLLCSIVPLGIFRLCGAAVLITLGALTIAKSLVRSLIRRISDRGELSVKMGGSPLILKLYLDDTAADADHSKLISAGEAAALALASSLDSAATGISCGYGDISPFTAFSAAFVCGAAALSLGSFTGRKISSLHHDLSWAGGLLLIIFAVFSA